MNNEIDLDKLQALYKKAVTGKLQVPRGTTKIVTDTFPSGQIGICAVSDDAKWFVAIHNSFPALLNKLKAAGERIQRLVEVQALFEPWVSETDLIERDERMKTLGASEWVQSQAALARHYNRHTTAYKTDWLEQEAERLRLKTQEP